MVTPGLSVVTRQPQGTSSKTIARLITSNLPVQNFERVLETSTRPPLHHFSFLYLYLMSSSDDDDSFTWLWSITRIKAACC